MGERGQYLYAVTREIDPASLSGHGIGDVPLRALVHGDLVAVLSEVDLAEFGEEGLRRNLEDLAWLERVARGHDAVVQTVAQVAPVAPMRLATIFHDDAGVRTRLDELHGALTAALERVHGRQEWSVKTYAAPFREEAGTAASEAAAGPSGAGAPGAGAAYLQRKRTQALRQHTAQEEAQRTADTVHATLAARCVASRRLRPQDPRLTGHAGVMTLNGAYLVEDAEAAAFAAEAARLVAANPDAAIEVGGPWPPYSFATLEQP